MPLVALSHVTAGAFHVLVASSHVSSAVAAYVRVRPAGFWERMAASVAAGSGVSEVRVNTAIRYGLPLRSISDTFLVPDSVAWAAAIIASGVPRRNAGGLVICARCAASLRPGVSM